ncbi:MAG: phosphoadenylyl-sulfate reductase [Candidatus Methylomirabilis oxyfera]|nr:phosphoadenylyl-sulfate reductase [Candidatus Methylomirabilis oxyfera]
MKPQSSVSTTDKHRPVFSPTTLRELNQRFQAAPIGELLGWAIDTFSPKLALANSFGAEDVLLIDMLSTLHPPTKIFTLDTGRLPEETFEVMERVLERYKVAIESYFPEREAVERLERERGFYSFRRSVEERKFCCRIRKVEPLGRALVGVDAWMTGLRREQAATRTGLDIVEIDESHGSIVKLNPLAAWTEQQVWDYIRTHNVPYNALHDRGYPSIGCAPCTRAVQPGEDIRAGRWWWENPTTKECGLHLTPGNGDPGRKT